MTGIRSLPLDQILRSRKRLRRELLESDATTKVKRRPIRVAVLGGVTTNEVVDMLDLLLLSDGFEPTFYQSEYNRFFEDATLDVKTIADFKPDVVYLHTHFLNISQKPSPAFTEADLEACVNEEMERWKHIWESLHTNVQCQIIQNNFEHPPFPAMGNFDSTAYGGQTRLVHELNRAFAKHAAADRRLVIQDLNGIAANLGLAQWFDWERWYSYKILTTSEGSFAIANSLSSLVGAMLGRAKKVLILDLDNTLWGGVIGDDGVDNLHIGRETALAEAYTAFQEYCLSLRNRGVLLAVCSKNEASIAQTGFEHPDSILKLEHFSAFKANWDPKHHNIEQIAHELSLGIDSFVFVDDNPAERAIVRGQLPMVAVPEVGSDVSQYARIVQAGRYFEMVTVSKEDLTRGDAYAANLKRNTQQSKFKDYGEYLDSLQMSAEIGAFKPVYLERIAQLINKTNQFNLTTKRYTFAEVEQIANDTKQYVNLYGRLADMFGDNGLISVIIGRHVESTINIDLWIMSCRVLKRDMESAMLDALVESAKAHGATRLKGSYKRTPKNGLVAEHYRNMGFQLASSETDLDNSEWTLDLASYTPKNRHIKVG